MYNYSISAVIPAYNEEENITQLIEKLYVFLKDNFSDFEIIVVDDGSRDFTYSRVLSLKNRLEKNLLLIRHKKNMGYGAALRDGLFSASKSLVFYTDSDNQFDIRDISKLVEHIKYYDIVVGYRKDRKDPALRKVASFVYNRIIRILFNLKVKDIDCSFKLFKRDNLRQLSIERSGFFVDTELLLKSKSRGFKIKEIGVRHFPRLRGKSTVGVMHIYKTIVDICHFYSKKLRHKL